MANRALGATSAIDTCAEAGDSVGPVFYPGLEGRQILAQGKSAPLRVHHLRVGELNALLRPAS